jgi:hypothetical protein
MSEAIETFFRKWERNSNLGDAEQLASQFADSFTSADPSGARVVQAADLQAAIPTRKQLLDSVGCRSTTLVSLHETRLDDHYVMVNTQWRWHFDREEITLPSTFILYRSGETLRIVFYLHHENIMTVLRDRGLLPQDRP